MLMRGLIAMALAFVLVAAIAATGCTRACSSPDACGTGEVCVYKIGDCSAQGECQDIPNPECGYTGQVCGCNGSPVAVGCGVPDGYASGPTTGTDDYSCLKDSGSPIPSQGFPAPDAAEIDSSSDQ
jgi:hypothetical protein